MPSSSSTSTAAEYERQFLDILNNERKGKKDLPSRKRGFVVLARGTSSLARLQDLCFDKRQSWNHCMTARYRLKQPDIFGTLLVSFLFDLKKIHVDHDDLKGNFKPAPSESVWSHLTFFGLTSIGMSIAAPPMTAIEELDPKVKGKSSRDTTEDLLNSAPQPRGNLTPAQLNEIIESLAPDPPARPPVLSKGDRLVLFAEVSAEPASLEEWNAAKEVLFNRLPERMGLVLSGAPADFKLTDDPTDPHFLDLRLPEGEESPATTKSVVKFSNASFHRDQPASRDELDVNDYANALARFILHKQTLPPLTVGIHGRWGKGKSSFMKMVDNALVKYADINIQRPKIWRWQPRRAIPHELASNPLTRFIRRLDAVQTEEPARHGKMQRLSWGVDQG